MITIFVRLATSIRNKPATKPVILKVCNVKLKFDIWLVLSEFKVVNSNYFMFSFLICYFLLFYFYFGDLGLGLI